MISAGSGKRLLLPLENICLLLAAMSKTPPQFNVNVQFSFEFVSQPGSPWKIVSLCAVLDADLHRSISGCCRCSFARPLYQKFIVLVLKKYDNGL
jgi:hypothetical protein